MTPNPTVRVRWTYDDDARFEECNGEPRPLTESEYTDHAYYKDGQPVSYADYLSYYGNPDRHVYLGCLVDVACPTCGQYETRASLWRIDFMDDSPEWYAIHLDKPLSVADALALPGYAADVVRELLQEADQDVPPC